MAVIDDILLEWSYRCSDGIVDMNNPIKKAILDEILIELGMDPSYKPLTFFDLNKRGGFRFKIIADKIKNNQPFSLIQGEPTTLEFINPEFQSAFENSDNIKIKQLSPSNINGFKFFEDENGKEYSISDLMKDKDFGGKGEGSGTHIEITVLKGLLQQLENTGPINVKVGNNIYNNISGGYKVAGNHKADLILTNTESNPLVFISHKNGNSAKDFQQYGGVAKDFSTNPEVISFAEDVKKIIAEKGQTEMIRGGGFKRLINNKDLLHKSIYGIDFGKEFGENNVQILCQGKLRFDKVEDNTYELTSEHNIYPPTIPDEGYTPVLMATFREGRNDLGIKNCRIGIYPIATRQTAKEI
jgi:hypothetical protein